VDGHAAAPGHRPTCRRCGSDRLRRSHSRSRLQKLFRRSTAWDRYACGGCGHRGWARGKVPTRGELEAAAATPPVAGATGIPSPTGGRRLERRDHRLKRRLRLRTFVAVALSLVLGIVAALYLQRCGAAPPPPME
jgi:hypothetical protein